MSTGIGIKINTATFPSNFPTLNWAPSSLSANLAAWYDVGSGLTSASSRASALLDQGPNGLNLSQGTSGQQPLVVTNAKNSRPGIKNDATATPLRGLVGSAGDGVTQFAKAMPFSYAVALILGSAVGSNGKFCFGNTVQNGQPVGWALDTATNTWNANTGRKATALFMGGTSSASLSVYGNTTLSNGNAYIIVVTYDGTGTLAGVTITVNGVAQTVTASNSGLVEFTNSGSVLFVGSNASAASANFYSDDTVLEAFIGKTKWDASTISNASAYLNRRFAIY